MKASTMECTHETSGFECHYMIIFSVVENKILPSKHDFGQGVFGPYGLGLMKLVAFDFTQCKNIRTHGHSHDLLAEGDASSIRLPDQ